MKLGKKILIITSAIALVAVIAVTSVFALIMQDVAVKTKVNFTLEKYVNATYSVSMSDTSGTEYDIVSTQEIDRVDSTANKSHSLEAYHFKQIPDSKLPAGTELGTVLVYDLVYTFFIRNNEGGIPLYVNFAPLSLSTTTFQATLREGNAVKSFGSNLTIPALGEKEYTITIKVKGENGQVNSHIEDEFQNVSFDLDILLKTTI